MVSKEIGESGTGRFRGRRRQAAATAAALIVDESARPEYLRLAYDPALGIDLAAFVFDALADDLSADRVRVVPYRESPAHSVGRSVDLCLVALWPGEDPPEDVEILPIGGDRLVVVSRVPLPEAARVSPGTLRHLPLVVGPAGPVTERVLVKLLSRPAFPARIHQRVPDTALVGALLEMVDSYTVVPERYAALLPARLQVRLLGPEVFRTTSLLLVDPKIATDEEVFRLILRVHAAAERFTHGDASGPGPS